MILIDIENFSHINEYYGYDIGDKILVLLASEIKNNFEKVFRISGDEFAILCGHELDNETKDTLLNMITKLEQKIYTVENNPISLSLSCGVSHDRKSIIYRQAHMALKENRNSNTQLIIFNDNKEIENLIAENIRVTNMIKNAISSDMITPFVQGIYDHKMQKIYKYETLMRLKNNEGEFLSPFYFLEQAKKSKLYTKLTKAIIRKSFDMFKNNGYDFSINISMQDIESKKINKLLFDNIQKLDIGQRLTVEIVESESMQNYQQVIDFIKKLKNYGCKIALDDFGSGYSNFEYVIKMDIDYIKIDGSLIKNINKDQNKYIIVESILNFTKKLGIKRDRLEFCVNEF